MLITSIRGRKMFNGKKEISVTFSHLLELNVKLHLNVL